MYKYKLDHASIRSSVELTLLYTIVEQNERIIELLLKQNGLFACETCGEVFNTPVQKATHVRSCGK